MNDSLVCDDSDEIEELRACKRLLRQSRLEANLYKEKLRKNMNEMNKLATAFETTSQDPAIREAIFSLSTGMERIEARYDRLQESLEIAKMENETLRGLLRIYGDHRWKCSIQKAMTDGKASAYPACDCGWEKKSRPPEKDDSLEISHAVRLLRAENI